MIEGLLVGKNVLIMGAGSGVGRAASLLFAKHGAQLALADIREDLAKETVALVNDQGGQAIAIACDVTKRAEVDAAVQTTVKTYGRLDVIYNNVGIPSPKRGLVVAKMAENTGEEIDRLIDVNVKGIMHGCQAAANQFRAQGGGGVIVNTASVAGMIGWGGVLYGATKGAVVNLTRGLAIELAADGIRINNVCPAAMVTPFMTDGYKGQLTDEMVKQIGAAHPLGKVIDPLDTANAALFLASDLSANVTGVNLPVDGGISAGRSV